VTGPLLPLVWAKLQPPMLPHQTVERAVLIDQLTSITDPALTAIVAPAGYGKTTTAVQLCERLGGLHQTGMGDHQVVGLLFGVA